MRRIVAVTAWTVLFMVSGVFAQGTVWSIESSGTLSNLRGVSHSDTAIWIAVGDNGTILRSSDGGKLWSSVSSPIVDHLRGVSIRGTLGLAVGLSGQVLRSTDAGVSWTAEARPTSKNLYSVSVGDSVAVITGEEGTILVSTDAGVSWSPRTAGTASVLFGVSVSGRTAVGVGGQGAIVNSDNGGAGWGLQILGPSQQLFFYCTSFVNATTGWAAGAYQATGSIILKTTLYGFVWTVESAPTTNALFGISFTSTDSGTAVGAGGTVVRTTDGGGTWLSGESNTQQSLNAVSFVDGTRGVAVGDSGTILRSAAGGATGVAVQDMPGLPEAIRLDQNFPNPFNPSTRVRFTLRSPGHASLKVFDLIGNEVADLVDANLGAGPHEVTFDGAGQASGTYFYQLRSGSVVLTRKMTFLR